MPAPEGFPRLRDLIAGIMPAKRQKAWLRDFAQDHPRQQRFINIDPVLRLLPDTAWQDLKTTVLGQIDLHDPARGWPQALDLLNEARAYCYLDEIGYSEITFLPAHMAEKSPDLCASRNGRLLFCEVKTLHISARTGDLRAKLSARLNDAQRQLAGTPNAERLIYLVLECDGMSGAKAQVEGLLAGMPLSGIGVVIADNAI